jgi:arylformamidase
VTQRIIDLSLTFTANMRGVSYAQNTTIADTGYNTTNLHLYSHAGTHMDAPLHFINGGRTIDHLDLSKCIGPALVLDLSHIESNGIITVEDLAPLADKITAGTRLLMRTDWDLHADMDDYRSHMPRVSAALATWLVDKGVVLLGLETPSVASLRPENRAELTEVHQILLRAEVVIVESLANLRELKQETVQFTALPLKIDGCDGSPTRAVAIERV